MARYSELDLSIDFDNFVACLIRLETMFSESSKTSSKLTVVSLMMVIQTVSLPQTRSARWTKASPGLWSSAFCRYETPPFYRVWRITQVRSDGRHLSVQEEPGIQTCSYTPLRLNASGLKTQQSVRDELLEPGSGAAVSLHEPCDGCLPEQNINAPVDSPQWIKASLL